MTIYFGLELDNNVYPNIQKTQGGVLHLGTIGILHQLEIYLGLTGHPNDIEHIRIEQFRQTLLKHLKENTKDFDLFSQQNSNTIFYKESFIADQFATAARLLSMRDELVLAEWSFDIENKMPQRLKCLAEIEQYFSLKENPQILAAGFADRFIKMLKALDTKKQPFKTIFLNEPLDLLPAHFKKLFSKLKQIGASINILTAEKPTEKTNLALFQKAVLNGLENNKKLELKNDGSILIIKAKRETDAAAFLAKFFQKNKNYRPVCLIPEKNRTLDNAIKQEGLPSLGILSASLARPSLQILKLIPTFLWQPIDPFKIMEFVSLLEKPLADDLARLIAMRMAQTPGINGEAWHIMTSRYFEDLKNRAKEDSNIDVQAIRSQYDFWFQRKRYNANQSVPKTEVIEIFNYVKKWAADIFKEKSYTSLSVLSKQAERVCDLLEALPDSEKRLTTLQLERIVRTIYEPSPIPFEKQVDHLFYVHQSSAIIGNVDNLLWWNFIRREKDYFFSLWYKDEIEFLKNKAIKLQSPQDQNKLLLWHRIRPVVYCKKRIIFVIPQMVDGVEAFNHPLFDNLEATFSNLEKITFDIQNQKGKEVFNTFFQVPKQITLPYRNLGKPKPFIHLSKELEPREEESFSSLNTLFYYPYQWVFRHKILLKKSSILSVVKDNTLLGNLAHRFFEMLLKKDIEHWDKPQIELWIDEQAPKLLSREGSVLLMYGREPEKVAFINRVKYAACSLIAMIQSNGWKIKATEMNLAGYFQKVSIKGKADLVLERGDELAIVDFKWRGARRRENMIRNEEDLQLITYAKLTTDDDTWAHTAYFILENGKMIARNQFAFKEAITISSDTEHIEINQKIFAKMEASYRWRMEQMKNGKIEVRTKMTITEIEDEYHDNLNELMELLEMKNDDAPFDDYRTLINLID